MVLRYICKHSFPKNEFTMVNSEKFSERLQMVMTYYDISAASFADAIEVGRSSISHILSGRNKPSLDFVLKIVQAYPEVELYWLLNGKGTFPNTPVAQNEQQYSAKETPAPASQSSANITATAEPSMAAADSGSKKIKKIVIFYSDGSFEAFEN